MRRLILLLAACAVPALADDEYKAVHTVAVVPAMGDIAMERTGSLPFQYDMTRLNADWSLDADIAKLAASELSPRFTVKVLAAGPFETRSDETFDNVWSDMKAYVKAQPKDNGIDAYVFIVPQPLAGDVRGAWGARLRHIVPTFKDPVTMAIASYEVAVYDPSGSRIDYGDGQLAGADTLSGFGPPAETCDNAMWADRHEDLTPAQTALIRREMESLIGHSLGYGLANARLIDKAGAEAADKSAPPHLDSCKPFP